MQTIINEVKDGLHERTSEIAVRMLLPGPISRICVYERIECYATFSREVVNLRSVVNALDVEWVAEKATTEPCNS
jgi:hypothetical protein